jgi:spermidine/putrescine transport system permease protein
MRRTTDAWLSLLPGAAYLFLFFLLPFGMVLAYSFLEPNTYGGTTGRFSLESYRALARPDYLLIFWRSLRLAGWTALLCALLAYPAAWFISRLPARRQAPWLLALTLPAWVNLLVKNYAWLILLRKEGPVNQAIQGLGLSGEPLALLYSEGAILIGLLHTFLPFMILPLYASLERLDGRLFEAAQDLGAGRWQLFRRVILPQSRGGLAAGLLLVFVPAFGSFLTPDLLGGAGAMMSGSLIQQQFFVARNWPLGAALSVSSMALILALFPLFRKAQQEPVL